MFGLWEERKKKKKKKACVSRGSAVFICEPGTRGGSRETRSREVGTARGHVAA